MWAYNVATIQKSRGHENQMVQANHVYESRGTSLQARSCCHRPKSRIPEGTICRCGGISHQEGKHGIPPSLPREGVSTRESSSPHSTPTPPLCPYPLTRGQCGAWSVKTQNLNLPAKTRRRCVPPPHTSTRPTLYRNPHLASRANEQTAWPTHVSHA